MVSKISKITVEEKIINISTHNDQDYICLTDIVRGEEGNDHIRNWMRNRNTVEFLGLWEQLYNPDFKGVEFDTFKKEAGLNSFNLTPKKWVEKTNAIGIISKSGKTGGTYAQRDIAFEFGAWISPMFKLLLIKEFQRLKEIESDKYNLEWNVNRVLSKINYHIHTDAVKNHIIPKSNYSIDKQWIEYAEEADLLNVALFGCTAKQWKEVNQAQFLQGNNMRNFASINELTVMSNLESLNSELIKRGIQKNIRFETLKRIASEQLNILSSKDLIKSIKKQTDTTFIEEQKKIE